MSELLGRHNRTFKELEILKGEVYDSVVSMVTMCESLESKLDTVFGNTNPEIIQLVKSIHSRLDYLKGYSQ